MKISNIHLQFLKTDGICTDTRKVFRNCCFVALSGENFDGNNFVEQALELGAAMVICSKTVTLEDQRLIKVESPLKSLQELAKHHRSTFPFPVVSITGSNGKTTSKELIRDVLLMKGKVGATKGNLNNHIGVPLTLLSFTPDMEFGIVEMGANHRKEIELLCSIAQPDFVFITNIGKAHLEGFGGIEGVKKGKKELFDYAAKSDRTAFIQMNDPVIIDIAKGVKKQVQFGNNKHLPSASAHTKNGLLGIDFNFSSGELTCQTQLTGEYNLGNALAAAAIGQYFDIKPRDIVQAIGQYEPSNNRSELRKGKQNNIILDAYNANPTSMMNALEHLRENYPKNGIALIGDMLEMGEESEKEHQTVVDYLRTNHMQAILVGEEFKKTKGGDQFHFYDDAMEAYEAIEAAPINGKTVLLKGSRGITLEKLLPLL